MDKKHLVAFAVFALLTISAFLGFQNLKTSTEVVEEPGTVEETDAETVEETDAEAVELDVEAEPDADAEAAEPDVDAEESEPVEE